MYVPITAALYFSSIRFTVFLAFNLCNLSKVHQDYSINGTDFIGKPCRFNLIVKRRNFNRRPPTIRNISSFNSFKIAIKTYYFKLAFKL